MYFLNRSRFVSRATIERNRTLELRFARHPSIKIVQWSFSFLLFFFFSSLEKFPFFFLIRVCIQNIECTRESWIITIYKRRVILIISMEEDEHFFFLLFLFLFFCLLSTRLFETREELVRAINCRESRDIVIASCLRTNENYSWEDWLEKKKRTRAVLFLSWRSFFVVDGASKSRFKSRS